MNRSEMSNYCSFGGKANTFKEMHGYSSSSSSEELLLKNQLVTASSQIEPKRKIKGNSTRTDKATAATERRFQFSRNKIEISKEVYRILSDNLYLANLLFMRCRIITMNQLNRYKKEAIGHMHEMKRIIYKELEDTEFPAKCVAEELVKAGISVIQNQHALTRIEIDEIITNLNNLLDALSSDIQTVKSLTESEYKKEIEKRSAKSTFNNQHWCFFALCILIILTIGLGCYFLVYF